MNIGCENRNYFDNCVKRNNVIILTKDKRNKKKNND